MNILKLSFVFILSTLLFGCSPTVENFKIESFTNKCASHKGIHEIDTFLITAAQCNDGAWVRWNE